jgi:hypothetical protein
LAHSVFALSKEQNLQNVPLAVSRALRLEPFPDIEYMLFLVTKKRQKLMEVHDGGAEEIAQGLKMARLNQEECKKHIKTFWHNLLTEVELGSLNEVVMNVEKHESIAEKYYKRVIQFSPYLTLKVTVKMAQERYSFEGICNIFGRYQRRS